MALNKQKKLQYIEQILEEILGQLLGKLLGQILMMTRTHT